MSKQDTIIEDVADALVSLCIDEGHDGVIKEIAAILVDLGLIEER